MSFLERSHKYIVLAYLALAQALVFGRLFNKVGFYLDDWETMKELKFGPAGLFGHLQALMHDAKILIRPVQALHYGMLYTVFGTKPLWYHIVNAAMEVVAAWLLYLVVEKLCRHRLLAFASAALFLLSPTHDSTHYWVLASSATLSILLYLGSLLATIKSAETGKRAPKIISLICFAASIFNYECFLPLCIVNVVAAGFVRFRVRREAVVFSGAVEEAKYAATISAKWLTYFVAVICSYWGWSRMIVPHIGRAWVHSVSISPANVISTVLSGTVLSLPSPATVDFLCKQSLAGLSNGCGGPIAVGLLAALTIGVSIALAKRNDEAHSRNVPAVAALPVSIAAVATIALSYTIFGLNSEYVPTLTTLVNRINYGGAIGASVLLAVVIVLLTSRFKRTNLQSATTGVAVAALLAFFSLATWGMSKPWTLSWTMQKHVQDVIANNKRTLRNASAVMLVNSPRYVYWSPVFDGTWDFQSLLQITLNDESAQGDVVSERLRIADNKLQDVSHEYVVGTFQFKKMFALVAPTSRVAAVTTPPDFIDIVQNEGMGFDLDRSMPNKWRQQLLLSSRSASAY